MAEIFNSSPIYNIGSEEIKYQVIEDKGPEFNGKYRIKFFDIDGNILKTEYLSEGETPTPPENPSFDPDYLIFNNWNYDIENLQVDSPMNIGAMYNTINDKAYIFIDFRYLKPSEDLTIEIGVSTYSSYEINWGDGLISTDTISHTYSASGKYIITISGYLNQKILMTKNHLITKAYLPSNYVMASNFGSFSDASNLKYVSFPRIINSNYSESTQYLFQYANNLIHCNLPMIINNKTLRIGTYSFRYCDNLKSISFPANIEFAGSSPFVYTYNLNELIFPKGTQFKNYNYLITDSLVQYMTIPPQDNNLIYIAAFQTGNLKHIKVPEGITTLQDSCFYKNNMVFIDLPSTLTTIESQALDGNAFHTIIIRSTVAPILGNSNGLGYKSAITNNGLIIWVNDSILEELKVKENWSYYANYMKPLSQYEGDY